MLIMPELKNKSGIYQIRNLVNGKLYVGSTINLYKRGGEHRRDLRANRHTSPKLQRAWNKYGESCFVFEVLESPIEASQLEDRERFWIAKLDACDRNTGYNTRPDAATCRGVPKSAETKAKIAATLRGRKRPPEVGQKISAIKRANPWKPSPEAIESKRQKMKGRNPPKSALEGAKRFREENPSHNLEKLGAEFSFTAPDGVIHTGKGIRAFAIRMGLDYRALSHVHTQRKRSYKGWTKTGGKSIGRIAYRLQAPDGTIHEGIDLGRFAANHGLRYDGLRDLVKGRIKSSHGWTIPDSGVTPFFNRRSFKVTAPDGTVHEGVNLTAFCREHDLDMKAVHAVVKERRKHYNGWTKAD